MRRSRGVSALIAILAGGEGRRLGGGKAEAELAGRPLIAYPLAAAREAGSDVAVFAKEGDSLPRVSVPVIREPAGRRHPLCGILAALREAGGAAVVALGCDLPFVTAELLRWLGDLPDSLAVPEFDGRLHPLLARYGPSLQQPLEGALERERPLRNAVSELGPRLIGSAELSRFGDPRELLFNVNRPEDLDRAEQIVRQRS
jgi:molybdopterin-guanine dinucleotide biosynthesis protein A